MEEEEPEKVMGLTLFGLESSEPAKVPLRQYTLGDALRGTQQRNSRLWAMTPKKVKPANSIVTANRFSVLASFNTPEVDEMEETKNETCGSSGVGGCTHRKCPCAGGWNLGKNTKNKKKRDSMNMDDFNRVLADLANGDPLSSVIPGGEVQDIPVNVLYDDIPLNEVNDGPRWRRITSVMDSGAADSVAPEDIASWVPVAESAGSKRGQHYLSASGDRLPNLGQKRLQVVTDEGKETTTTYQIADVTRPLCAVSKACDSGNVVVFTKEGGFVQSPNGERTKFRRDQNVYLLDTWIREPASGFTRPC